MVENNITMSWIVCSVATTTSNVVDRSFDISCAQCQVLSPKFRHDLRCHD